MSLEDKLYPLLSLYERMPRDLKHAAGWIYRRLPESFRRGEHYHEFKQLAEQGETWTAERILEFQTQELRKVLIHAQHRCPFYRRRFGEARFDANNFSAIEDLHLCPLLTRQD